MDGVADDAGAQSVHLTDPLRLERNLPDPLLLPAGHARVRQLLQRRPGDLHGGSQDEHRYHYGAHVVQEVPGRMQPGGQHRQDRRNRAERVRAVVPRVGHHGVGAGPPAHCDRPAVEDLLADDGDQRGRQRDESGRGGMGPLKRGQRPPSKAEGRRRQQQAYQQRHERLDAAVPVGVVPVRGPGPVTHADQHRDVRGAVGEAVDGVRDDDLAVPQQPAGQLQGGQGRVPDQARPRDPANPGHVLVSRLSDCLLWHCAPSAWFSVAWPAGYHASAHGVRMCQSVSRW